jgi:hypothetical protein
VDHQADDKRREDHRADGEHQNRAQIGLEVPPHSEIGACLQQRRQKQHQHIIGIDVEGQPRRREGERHAADDIGCGGRHMQPARDKGENDRSREQSEENDEGAVADHEVSQWGGIPLN